jgi:outer membrane protein OmpA-like peptidoglycan-associated protein
MKQVEIDPESLKTEPSPQKKPQTQVPINLGKEKPQSDGNGMATGTKMILSKPGESIPLDKPDPQISSTGLENVLPKANKEIESTQTTDLSMKEEESLKLPEPIDGMNDHPGVNKVNGSGQFSSLDDLLEGEGVVKKNTAPILMPTDLLFEYDSATLKPEAAATLAKLGSLIKKNARASFRIEGHTDSFGTDEYNMNLSLRRAEAVKTWLTSTMGLDSSRISTVGLGKTRLLVPATGTVEQQQLNRRVEIVISLPR